MKNHRFIVVISSLLFNHICFAQTQQSPKFFLSAGYGLSGSFFVRSYTEWAPLPRYKVFYKKHFIGVAQNAAIGINLKNGWEARFGINYQHFTRRVVSKDTLNNVFINLDHDIHERDYMWQGNVARKLGSHKNLFVVGLGLYYLRPKTQVVEIFPGYVGDIEPQFKDSHEEEGGAVVEFAYEYKFQPRVNIGIKTQFYYTITAAYAESMTLFPYMKILF